MNGRVAVKECAACSHAVFPPRHVCPRCHASEWRDLEVPTAKVEQTTTLRYRTGVSGDQPEIELATVATDPGPRLIVRLERAAQPGEDIELSVDRGRITGR
jgi:uncharacterized OB-fold protein